MKKLSLKKGQILQSAGELNTKVYSVLSGLLRSYTIDEKGKEHIYMFAPEGWLIADNSPLNIPCDLFIDVLEDSEVSVLEKHNLDGVSDTKKLLKRMWVLQQRITRLMSSTALERYDHFLETYPDIVQRVSQRMIASYLGITPEALSKVKGQRLKNNK
ncbi:MAG: CRP-like cAMP-binding protein [Saprospiraceae bacterium]